jgi:hypothetical protein
MEQYVLSKAISIEACLSISVYPLTQIERERELQGAKCASIT